MKLLKTMSICCALSLFTTLAFAAVENLGPNAQGYQSEGELGPEGEDDIDPKILRKFIEDQGLIESRNKEGRLIIAGDVRARWMNTHERLNGVNQRGFNNAAETAVNTFKSEINLIIDYTAPTSWAETKLRFANFDGRDGGTATKVEMDRAFLGYVPYENDEHSEELYIELGRNRLDTLFDSKVQFTSFFDGILITYQRDFKCAGFFNIHGGPMIVDSYTNHYAWIVETSLKKILGTNLSIKYSFVDWRKRGTTVYYGNLPVTTAAIAANTPLGFTPQLPNNPRYRFAISQVLVGYEFEPSDFLWCKPSWFYAGGLINHAAESISQTYYTKQNLAWFIGFTVGKLKKRGDWSIDMNYQFVEPQAVPDFDAAGIGHGNAADVLFSDSIIAGNEPGIARGFINYRGFEMTGLYALTDSLSLKAKYQHSKQVQKHIGGLVDYHNLELAAIFAF